MNVRTATMANLTRVRLRARRGASETRRYNLGIWFTNWWLSALMGLLQSFWPVHFPYLFTSHMCVAI